MKTLVVLLALLALWDLGWMVAGVGQMPPWRLKRLLRESPEQLRIVDVRTKFEYDLFHIQGAEHRPDLLYNPDAFDPASDNTAITVIVCMTGHRSPIAASRLDAGPDAPRVYNLTWGMLGWLASFGSVVSGR